MSNALVFGGGGVAGIAWELGVLQGLAECGVNVGEADLVVGTSAGACVGAQLASSTPILDLYAIQTDPDGLALERAVEFDMGKLVAIFQELQNAGSGDAKTAVLARVGAMAIDAPTPSEVERRAIIASRLPLEVWPTRRLLITAVDALTGEFVVFNSASDASLIDAVTASCAVPGVWPPTTIGDRRFIDGGVRSPINADLADGCLKVLIFAPSGSASVVIESEQRALEQNGSDVFVISANEASLSAFGPNPLDPSTRVPSALAGRAQGMAIAETVGRFWQLTTDFVDGP